MDKPPTHAQRSLELLKSLSVLYVEDDDEVRAELARFLGRRVRHLEVAADGRAGLEAYLARRHDVVVTDVKMPGMDGLEMAEAIKASDDEVPIIVITAFSEKDYLLRAIELGVDRYVTKPIDPDILVDAIYQGSRSHLQRRELDHARQRTLDVLEETITALSRSIEKRDPCTDGHQKRVALLAVAIGEELALPADRIAGLRLGALVHDVGKIQVPADILSKPGQLRDVEKRLISEHASAGREILADVSFPWPIADMVGQHHERIDGSGYPLGLKDGEILLEARIIAVADVVEAMTAHRPYRAALGLDQAIAELQAGRGSRYEAEIVDACLRVVARRPELVSAGAS